ncbi:MAG TPA: cell division protein ZapA [bacterium]
MSDSKKVYKVRIFGNELNIKSDDTQEHVDAVVEYVRRKFTEVQMQIKSSSMLNLAILCAMNIADEFFKLKAERENMEKNYEERVTVLTSAIKEAIK